MKAVSMAIFSGTLRRGVIFTENTTYVIEESKMYKPEKAGDYQEMDADEHPFIKVYDCLKKSVEEREARIGPRAWA